MPFHVDAIDHVVLNCHDVDVTAQWYAAALGVQVQTYDGGRTALTFGTQKLNLRPVGTADWETARTDAAGTLDICFVTTSSLDDVAATWRATRSTPTATSSRSPTTTESAGYDQPKRAATAVIRRSRSSRSRRVRGETSA